MHTKLMRSLANPWNSLAHRLAWPYVELVIRLWIAKLFFYFSVQELMHWTTFLQTVRDENPLPGLTPPVSAYLSTGADAICAILLAVGFMTRYASLPLLGLAVITQFRFEAFDTQLFWIAIFCWFAIHGAAIGCFRRVVQSRLAMRPIPTYATNSGRYSRDWTRARCVSPFPA
jgi:putative oxidoreductase